MQSILCRRMTGLMLTACLLFTLFSPITSVKAVSPLPLTPIYSIGGDTRDIEISGNKAFVLIGNNFTIYSLANPDQPAWLGSMLIPGALYTNLIIRGSLAYLLDFNGYLDIINIGDPAHPALVNHMKVSDFRTSDMVFYEHYLYIAGSKQATCCQTEMHVYDITDPVSPIQLNVFDSWGDQHQNFIVIGSYLYVDTFYTLYRISLADPVHPGNFKPIYSENFGSYHPFALDGTTLYAPFPIDVSDPANPVIKDNPLGITYAWDVAITDNGILYAYLRNFNSIYAVSLYIWNTKEPGSAPVIINTNTQMFKMVPYQNRLYVTSGAEGGFTIVDTSDPSKFTIVRHLDTPGLQSQLINVNEKLYTYQPVGRRLHAFDISQPKTIQWLGSIPLDADPKDLVAGGNILAVLTQSGLKLIDTTSPDGLRITGSDSTASTASRVLLYQNTAYLYSYSDTTKLASLAVEDIADPANPHQINSLDNLPEVKNFGIYSHYLYLGTDFHIVVVDLTDPHMPVIVNTVGMYSGSVYLETLVFVGRFMYTNSSIYSLTDPVNPVLSGELPFYLPSITNFKINGNTGYQVVQVNNTNLLELYNLADPRKPVLINQYQMGCSTPALIHHGRVYDVCNGLTMSLLPGFQQVYLPALSRN